MNDTDSRQPKPTDQTPDDAAPTSGEAQADQVAEGLRDQIAALRKQVKVAQDTLREHHRRRQEGRSFKR